MLMLENTKAYKIKSGALVNELNQIKGTKFVNVSSNPKKIEVDIDIIEDKIHLYTKQISEKLGMSEQTLEFIMENLSRKLEGGVFRISIPLLRNHVGCYCGVGFFKKEYFKEGLLLLNRYEGRYPITILPEHEYLIDEYYNSLIERLERINMSEDNFNATCPAITPKEGNIGHFCKVCMNNKYRNIQKEKYFEYIAETKALQIKEATAQGGF